MAYACDRRAKATRSLRTCEDNSLAIATVIISIGPVKQIFVRKTVIIFLPSKVISDLGAQKNRLIETEYPQHMFSWRNKKIIIQLRTKYLA